MNIVGRQLLNTGKFTVKINIWDPKLLTIKTRWLLVEATATCNIGVTVHIFLFSFFLHLSLSICVCLRARVLLKKQKQNKKNPAKPEVPQFNVMKPRSINSKGVHEQ